MVCTYSSATANAINNINGGRKGHNQSQAISTSMIITNKGKTISCRKMWSPKGDQKHHKRLH